MAELYSEKDIVNRIHKWTGECKPINTAKKDTFTDLSPACVGLASKDKLLEKVLAIFDSTPGSYRVFNEIHITSGDKNLTIGCGHFANESLAKLFLAMPNEAWKEFRTFVADKLLANAKLFKQYSEDYVVADYLEGKNKTASDIKNVTALGESLDYFFGRDLLNGKNYSDIEGSAPLTNRYKYNKNSWTITESYKSYLSLWADTVLLLSSFDPKTGTPPEQFNAYTDYSDSRSVISLTKYVNKKVQPSTGTKSVRLFPGHEKDNHECEFWFYTILYDALLIKSVANWQHELWVSDYYNVCKKNFNALPAKEEAILPGLISWKSSGGTTLEGKPFPQTTIISWRNLGNKYYLESAREVRVAKGTNSDKIQKMIDTLLLTEGELFTAFIIWVQFAMSKHKMRSRLRTMWNIYFSVPFQKYKDNQATSVETSKISNAKLFVSESSIVLRITQKDEKDGKEVYSDHNYTFIK